MNKSLVSVIIPCYKDSTTLVRAIHSVKAQTYHPIEILVVNDCSPETEAIEACLKDFPSVRYLRNPVNLGLAATRNAGILAATGELVAFLDADDEYHPSKIACQIKVLEPGIVVTCGTLVIGTDGSTFISSAGKLNHDVTRASDLVLRNTLNGAAMLASKTTLLEHGLYDTNLRSCEDFDLYLRLLESGIKIRNVGKPLYLYYYSPQGLSKNIRSISGWEFEVIHRYIKRMDPYLRSSYNSVFVLVFWTLHHLLRSEIRSDEQLRKDTLARAEVIKDWPLVLFFLNVLARLRFLGIIGYSMRIKYKIQRSLSKTNIKGQDSGPEL